MNKHIYTQNKQNKLGEIIGTKKQSKHKHIISQPEPEIYLFAVGSCAGYPGFRCLLMFFFSKLFCFMYALMCFVFMCSPSRFKFLPEHNTIH